MLTKLCLTVASLALINLPAQAQTGFSPGELILYSSTSSKTASLTRINPITGAVTPFVSLQSYPSAFDPLAYDPWRDQVIFYGGPQATARAVYLADSSGNLTSLGFSAGPESEFTTGGFAPRGDGLIYFTHFFPTKRVSYFDQSNTAQVMMDASGTSVYQLPFFQNLADAIEYDPETNSLLIVSRPDGDFPCPGGSSLAFNFLTLNLSTDGTRVLSQSCMQFAYSPTNVHDLVMGLSPGPNGDFLMSFDTSNTGSHPRMVSVDIGASSVSEYSGTPALAMGGVFASTYSHLLGKAVLYYGPSNTLQAFSPAEGGNGSLVAKNATDSGGYGLFSSLVEVSSGFTHANMMPSTDQITAATGGTQAWAIDFGPAHAGQIYLVLGSTTNWRPGLNISGVHVPLVVDAYTQFSIDNANSTALVNTLGFLNAQGQAPGNPSLNVPANISAALVGLTAYHTTITFDPSLAIAASSNPTTITFQ